MDREGIIAPCRTGEDSELDMSLRPLTLSDFIGQDRVKEQLSVFIPAARKRKEPLDHVLFYGPPGLGKTTLSQIIAAEMGAGLTGTSGPVIERPIDLSAVLSHVKEGDIIFIDEIHRLNHSVEEILYPAMEDFKLDIMVGKGPGARTVKLELPPHTLIGATTRAGLITSPLRARFGLVIRLGYYEIDDMVKIVRRSSGILGVPVDGEGALEIARRSRGTPRISNRLLKRVRDYAQVKSDGRITLEIAKKALELLEVDEYGLDEMDKYILSTIIGKFSGGPVGLNTIATAVGEEKETLEEVYEPYLVQEGYLEITRQGRKAAAKAYSRLGLEPPADSGETLW